ncbi:MAG: OmcA/MtrC family decaheme c-type cytochrome [Bryobacteraceae bacterium]|nr:OmcA/MtrC family decaheme c-type cytochrome [Bryobacteraceae bacterium]
MNEKDVSFVRPGLVMKVTGATVAADGTVRVNFKLTDPRGLPLDREGIVTPGTVATSWIISTIPTGQTQYQAYTTRVQTSPRTGKVNTQASSDTGGTYTKVADGEYIYQFGLKLPAAADRAATHSIGMYGSRNLAEFDLGTQYDDDVYNFIPNGGTVTVVRDIIRTETCNKCHDPLAIHGGSRRTMELCNLCHTQRTFSTPDNLDPDTGNTIDMTTMIHKIHAGDELPSVKAGTPYQIVGFGNSLHDYSEVVFPSLGARNCEACHGQDSAAQKNNWLMKPTRQACGACHDDVNFATGKGHVDLPQLSDNQCTNCHIPEGELDFDASIKGAHRVAKLSPMLPGAVATISRVANTAAGQKPTVTFTLKDKAGAPLMASGMTTLRAYWAGPTTDYGRYQQEDARTATCDAQGTCTYTFTNALPADARGSWSIYMEGYRELTILPGTAKAVTQRDAFVNPIRYFSTDSSPIVERRVVVSMDKCNACHGALALHGDQRNNTQGCVVCHNPNITDAARRPAGQMPAQTVDMKVMIHRIHTGLELDHEYTVYGFGGIPYDFTKVGYPGDRRNCAACHVNNSQQLTVKAGLLPTQDPRQAIPVIQPEAAACTACHSSIAAKSHALANTTSLGESCQACHGATSEFSVDRAHAR